MEVPVKLIFLTICCGLTAAQKPFSWSSSPKKTGGSMHEELQSFWPALDPNPEPTWQWTQQEPERAQVEVQEKLNVNPAFTWRFPSDPVEEPRYPPEFSLRQPESANSIAVTCGESLVRVEVQKDLLGIGKPILPSDIKLGDCPPSGESPSMLIFESPLPGCGSQLIMSEEALVYAFILHYTPSSMAGIQRTREVATNVECQYLRQHGVSTSGLSPTWAPFVDDRTSEENLLFSLKLMTSDWQFERPSREYLLGDMINIEARVKQFHHTPLRGFIDRCVATLIPNADTVPRYSFLDNHGCLMDSKLTSSSSRFLPRVADDKLQFQLEAFKFQEDNRGTIYITCNLRATARTSPISRTNKACSFSDGWTEASGTQNVCDCCDTNCATGASKPLPAPASTWENEVVVGPIGIKERPL